MIAWLAVAFAGAPQDPVYLEPLVGVPRICVSMVPEAGPFKGKDAKTWARIRTDLEQARYERIPIQLAALKKPHPAKRSVEIWHRACSNPYQAPAETSARGESLPRGGCNVVSRQTV